VCPPRGSDCRYSAAPVTSHALSVPAQRWTHHCRLPAIWIAGTLPKLAIRHLVQPSVLNCQEMQVGLPRARRQNDCGRYFAPLSPHVATPSTSVSPFGRLQSQDLSWVDSPGKAFILDGESDPVALGDSASGDSSDDSSSVSTTSFDSCGSDPSDDSSSLSSDGTDSDESDWESEDEGLSQGSEDSLHVSQRSDMATV
jgi:hypothetical protein